MKPTLRVGLLWHAFGHANLGVDALARGNARLIGEAAARLGLATRFVTLGTGSHFGANVPAGVEVGPHPSIRQAVLGRSAFLAAIRGCDIVLDIGEGDSFTDLYGAKRFAYQAGTKIAVLAAGVPLVLSPQTIGPFAAPHHRFVAARILRRALAVHGRDGLSAHLAANLGAAAVQEFTDVAFALPFRPAPKAGRTRIGLNVSGLLWNRAVPTRLDYRALTLALLDELAQRPDTEVCLVAHVGGSDGIDNDEPVVESLARQYPTVTRAPAFADAEAAKSYLSGMDFVIAARMHAAIAAFSAGVPVVPIAYSRKVNGLFASLGYSHFVDTQAVDAAAARDQILACFEQRQVLAADIGTGRALAGQRLDAYRDEIERLLAPFAEVSAGRQHEAA